LEVDCLIADPHLAENELGWKATTSIYDMIDEMISEEQNALSAR
jgi:GDP-D-mannose dehydratase